MKIIEKKTAELIPYARNPRKNDDAVTGVAASIKEFGFKQPIVIDAEGVVVAGHTRLKAAQKLGLETVPCVVASDLTPAQVKAYRLLDNKVAEKADWDAELLKLELDDIDIDLEPFDVEFPELALAYAGADLSDDAAPEPPKQPFSKLGDLWLMGEHRVLCGDSTADNDVKRVRAESATSIVFTSPPYAQLRDYDGGVGDWDTLMNGVTNNLPTDNYVQVFVNLGIIYKDKEIYEYDRNWWNSLTIKGWRRFAIYCWDKQCVVPGDYCGRLAAQHENIYHINKQPRSPNKTIERVSTCRTIGGRRERDGSVSSYTVSEATHKIASSVVSVMAEKNSSDISATHPARFPIGLPAAFMNSYSLPGEWAYDPFLGSGTTLIAAQRLGRKCYGLELAPRYVDVICQRFYNETGIIPVKEDGTEFPVDRNGFKEKSVKDTQTQE